MAEVRPGELMLLISRQTPTPLLRILRGILAGAVGTAAMTLHQEVRQRLTQRHEQSEQENESSVGGEDEDPWRSAPAPAQVGKRLIEGVLDRPLSPQAIPALTRVMHWSYGSSWGGVYAIGRDSLRVGSQFLGPPFGLGVWAASYLQLVPLGIYQPPWSYELSAIADEIGYHLTYGVTVAASYEASGPLTKTWRRARRGRRLLH